MDESPAEAAILEHDPESSVTPEIDAGSQNTDISLPAASVTESQTAHDSEDLSTAETASPGPSACRSEVWNNSDDLLYSQHQERMIRIDFRD